VGGEPARVTSIRLPRRVSPGPARHRRRRTDWSSARGGVGIPRLLALTKTNVQKRQGFLRALPFLFSFLIFRCLTLALCTGRGSLPRVGAQRLTSSGLPLGLTGRAVRISCSQIRVKPTSTFSPVADACSRLAYCERPRRASRKARPWFSSVPAWEVATVSWTPYGDSGEILNPPVSR